MGLRRRSVRLRIFFLVLIPVLSVIGLYAFAVSITAGNALSVARTKTFKDSTALPVFELQGQIQAERLLAVIYLASPTPGHLGTLEAQEAKTDRARSVFTVAVTSPGTTSTSSLQETRAITAMRADVAGLPALRSLIAVRNISRTRATSQYERIVTDAANVVHEVVLQQTNAPLLGQELALTRMLAAEKILFDEDTLLTG